MYVIRVDHRNTQAFGYIRNNPNAPVGCSNSIVRTWKTKAGADKHLAKISSGWVARLWNIEVVAVEKEFFEAPIF